MLTVFNLHSQHTLTYVSHSVHSSDDLDFLFEQLLKVSHVNHFIFSLLTSQNNFSVEAKLFFSTMFEKSLA